jgi:O-antigen ligase
MKRTSLAVDGAFFAIVVLVPLAWSSAFIAEFTLAKFVVLNAALAFAAWGVLLRPEALAAGRTEADAWLLGGLFVACLSAAASSDPSTSLRGRYDSYAYGLWGMTLLAAVFQLAARFARGREADRLPWVIWSAACVGGYGVLQKLGVDPIFHLKGLPMGGRAVSTLGSPVDLGALLALIFPLALWRLDAERRPPYAVAALLVAGGIVACGSRGALLAAGVGTAAYALMSRRDSPRSLRVSLIAAAAAVAAAAAWSFRSGASVADIGRREVWRTALMIFSRSPLLGCGPDGFEDAFRVLRTDAFVAAMGPIHHQAYAHNDILHALANMGIAGVVVYGGLLMVLVRAARRALEPSATRALGAALAAGLLGLWVNLEINAVSLEVLAFGAIFGGLLVSLTSAASPEPFPRAPLAATAVLATLALVRAAGMAGVDVLFKQGARAQAAGEFAAAQTLYAQVRKAAPCETQYILGEANAVGDWINATHSVDTRLALLARADDGARAALMCHPRQILSHYIAGAAARMHADLGFKDQLIVAARELDQALALDPMFTPLIDARLQVARLMGDAKRAAELEARFAPPAPR